MPCQEQQHSAPLVVLQCEGKQNESNRNAHSKWFLNVGTILVMGLLQFVLNKGGWIAYFPLWHAFTCGFFLFLNVAYIAWIEKEFRKIDECSTLQIDLNTTSMCLGFFYCSDELLEENSASIYLSLVDTDAFCNTNYIRIFFLSQKFVIFLSKEISFYPLWRENNIIQFCFKLLHPKPLLMQVLQPFTCSLVTWKSLIRGSRKGFPLDAPPSGFAC